MSGPGVCADSTQVQGVEEQGVRGLELHVEGL